MLCTKGYDPVTEEATNNVKIGTIKKIHEKMHFCCVQLDTISLQRSDALCSTDHLAFEETFACLLS